MSSNDLRPRQLANRRWAIPLAITVGILLAWLGPSDWSAGPAILEIRYRDDIVLEVPAELDSSEAIEATTQHGEATVTAVAEGRDAAEDIHSVLIS